MSKEIINYNSKWEIHGYQEWWANQSYIKCLYHNGVPIDYEELYLRGELSQKRFYI